MSYEYSPEDYDEDEEDDEDDENGLVYLDDDDDENGLVDGPVYVDDPVDDTVYVNGPVYYDYATPPAYVIIGHGKERKINGKDHVMKDDVKYRVGPEQLSFIVKSGEVAYHDVIEIVNGLTTDLNAYKDFSTEDGTYIDIDVFYDPEVELGGLYLMYRGKIEDIWTLENGGDMTVSTLVQYVVDNHEHIMYTFLENNDLPKKYPIPEIRIWCLTCRAPYVQDEETRREPVYELPYEEDEWYNNEAFRTEHKWRLNGDGKYPRYRLKHVLNDNGNGNNDNYENNGNNGARNYGYGKGNGTHSLWGGSRKSIKRKSIKRKRYKKSTHKKALKRTTKKRMKRP